LVVFTVRKSLKATLILGLAALVTLIAAFANSDFDEYRQEIAAAVAAATGREVTIKGRVSFTLFPGLALKANKVTLSNAAWGTRPLMATVDEFAAEVDMLPFLFSRTVKLDRLVLRGVDVLLETDNKNRGNWDFAAPRDVKEKPGKKAKIQDPLLADLGRVRLERVRFGYRSGVTGRTLTGTIDRMEMRADGDGLKTVLVATYNGQKVDLNGRIGRLSQLLKPSAPWPLKLDVAVGETRLGLEGTVVEPLVGKGMALALKLEGRNLAGVGALAGVEIAKSRPFRLAATVSGDFGTQIILGDLRLDYGASKLAGDGRLSLQSRPRIEARLGGPQIDLTDIGLSFASKGAGANSGRIFSDKPIKLGVLSAIDLNITVDDARVRIDPLQFRQVAARVIIDNGRLTVDRVDGEFAGGKILGGMVLDARTPTVRLKTLFRLQDVDMSKIMHLFSAKEFVSGSVNGRLDIEGSGASWREIMAGLDGQMGVGMASGRINSKMAGYVDMVADFLTQMGDDPKGPRGMDVKCFVTRFDIKDGTATASALMLDTSRATLRGAGTVKLGSETLDILLKPNSTEGRMVTVSVPLHIHGTFLKPIIAPDEGTVAAGVAGAMAGAALGPIGLLIPLIAALRSSEQAACAPALAQVMAKGKTAAAPPAAPAATKAK
jgi:AsmA family protein